MSTRRRFLSAPLGIARQPRPVGRYATSWPRSGRPALAVVMRLDVGEQLATAAGLTRVRPHDLFCVDRSAPPTGAPRRAVEAARAAELRAHRATERHHEPAGEPRE